MFLLPLRCSKGAVIGEYGALLKYVSDLPEEVLGEIAQTYKHLKRVSSGQELQLSNTVKMLETTTSKEPTLICSNALENIGENIRLRFLISSAKFPKRLQVLKYS